jgi:hypothetical protein
LGRNGGDGKGSGDGWMDGCCFLGIKLSVLDWVMGWIWIRLQLNLQV